MIGHVGSRVGALVDGQLPLQEAERLWGHVHGCARCRARVEREGWVKMQLAGLASTWPVSAPLGLRAGIAEGASLAGGVPVAQGAAVGGRPSPDHRGLVTVAVVGATSLGAAMVGVIAMSVTSQGPTDGGPAVTSFQTTTTVPARARSVEP